MSLSFYVIGKIPAAKLKNVLTSGKIKDSSLVKGSKRNIVGIQYDKKGFWEGFVEKGYVVEFTEYAGGHGSDKAQDKLREQLERTFRCEITMDIDEYDAYVKKTTGKGLPKDPHAGCSEIEYSKKYPKGRCMDAPTGLPKGFWL